MTIHLDNKVQAMPSSFRIIDRLGRPSLMPPVFETADGKIVIHFRHENADDNVHNTFETAAQNFFPLAHGGQPQGGGNAAGQPAPPEMYRRLGADTMINMK